MRNKIKRKRRTRKHIIEDLSRNYVERYVLLCGYVLERHIHDYGIDCQMFTYNTRGEVKNGYVLFQLKASDKPRYINGRDKISVTLSYADLSYWLDEIHPVIIVLYDAMIGKAYWVHIQHYHKNVEDLSPPEGRKTKNIHVSTKNEIDKIAVRQFSKLNEKLYRQLKMEMKK